MELVGLVYTSRATHYVTPRSLDDLLLKARSANAALGVTGVLLHGAGQFFQYFEGSPSAVAEVYARIRRSTLHSHVTELESQGISQRRFQKWFMGFRTAPDTVLQKLSQEQWNRERPWVEDHAHNSPGIERLLAFVDPVSR